ncbi:MAG: lytic transglycosylase domain-containing protein [Xanthomonadaceae bacterium]|nr:lytic transglycosylase domain-containing protein [Xanthomonadaceae bacterium]MDE3072478.1 lytic transglycosylase domain-containing protein [Pseudomonadota bacterium]
MYGAASHGGSVGRAAGGFPTRSIRSRVAIFCVLLAGSCWLSAARAGTLYHCTGAHGEAVYSNSVAGYRGCRKISSYKVAVPRRRAPPRPASLTRVTAAVATTARSLAAADAGPASLAGVRGTVSTGAHALGSERVRHAALAGVQGSDQTSARALPAPATEAFPAGWSYRESRAAAPLAAAGPPGSRVLRGAVYRVVQPDGSVEYTNVHPVGGRGRAITMLFSYIATCVACDLHSPIHWGSVPLHLTAYAGAIRAASVEYGVDEAFLRAIIHAESAFNPRAMSLKGAQGLMQLMPATASDMGVLDAFDTDQNIRGGARYLGLLLSDFHGNEKLAAAAYNAGPAAVQRYSGVPPYAETRVYVERVEILRKRYGEAIQRSLAARGSG